LSKGLFNRLEGELEAREQSLGLKMADLLTLPDELSCLLNWMIRQGQVSLADTAAFLNQDETSARNLLAEVLGRGYVREIELREGTFYRVRLAPKPGRTLPANLWQALDDKCEHGKEGER
jgi:hypothetical protein